jgi:hypothetical protein
MVPLMRTFTLVIGAAIAARSLAAQQPQGCTASEYRAFDFWIGEWTVTDSAGSRTLGTNEITREENGCMLHEHWRGSGGGTGQSLNFFDRTRNEWGQLWVSSNGNVLRLSGGLVNGSMVLEGETRTAGGGMARNRITWTPQPDGRVRQLWSTSLDEGKSWQLSFDGWYRRVGTP